MIDRTGWMCVLMLNFLIAILSSTYEMTQAQAHLDHYVDLGFAALKNRCAHTWTLQKSCVGIFMRVMKLRTGGRALFLNQGAVR